MKEYKKISIKDCIQLAAPHTWVSSIIPALFAILLANIWGLELELKQKILLVLTCIFMQASVNTFNDYSDFVNGVDSIADTNLSRNDSAIVFNNINPKSVLKVAISYLLLGAIFGLLSLKDHKLIPIMCGFIGAVVVLAYSFGPWKLSYLPLGELFSGLIMGGLIPIAIIAVADGKIHLKILLYSLSIIIGIGLIMMTNNACDRIKDKKAGRNTLVIVLGIEKIRKLYSFLIVCAMALVIIFSVYFMNFIGLVIPSLSFIINRDLIKYLLNSKFLPEDRIKQMQAILKFNIVANGSYIIVMLLKSLGI